VGVSGLGFSSRLPEGSDSVQFMFYVLVEVKEGWVWGSGGGYGLGCPMLVGRSNCIVSHGNCLGRFLHSLVRVLKSVRDIAFGPVVAGMQS
jgi:hypothetical protein